MKKFAFLALAAAASLLCAVPASAGNVTLFSPVIGDVFFPGLTPTTLDSTVIGGTTPAAATVTTFNSTTSTSSGLTSAGSIQLDTGTKTATASSGAATLNKRSGKITTEALTTAGLADYTLTLTDSAIAAADEMFVSVTNGTNTQGTIDVGAVTPGAGSATIVIHNLHATQPLNGTLVITFMSLKN